MPSIKQIQNRLSNKKAILNKLNMDMSNAQSSKNSSVLRKLNLEKANLGRDIRKLERQLMIEKRASMEKKN